MIKNKKPIIMKTSEKYTRELKQQFGYLATWLPSTPLELGDIGVLKKNSFTKISNLSDFDIEFEVEPDFSKSNIEHSSSGSVSIVAKLSGTVAPSGSSLVQADAGFIVDFSKENAVFFKALGTTSPSIKNQIAVGSKIVEFFKAGKWDKSWVVVTEIVNAESATILISNSSNGKIELKVSGDVQAAQIDIADIGLGLKATFSKDLSTKIIANDALTPLFKVSKLKTKIFSPPAFEMKSANPVVMTTNGVTSIDLVTPEFAKENGDYLYFEELEPGVE